MAPPSLFLSIKLRTMLDAMVLRPIALQLLASWYLVYVRLRAQFGVDKDQLATQATAKQERIAKEKESDL